MVEPCFSAKPWIVLPAAGVGTRMAAERPKQYISLAGQPLVVHTLECLRRAFPQARCVVALAATDSWWAELPLKIRRSLHTCTGGSQRGESVWQALEAARDLGAKPEDWVLVHDAVRPLVPVSDLQLLWQQATQADCSAALGVPVVDSLRRVNQSNHIVGIESRDQVWRMFTPQIFRFSVLSAALSDPAVRRSCSDESQAVIDSGQSVLMVRGSEQNLKITYPEDLETAQRILVWRQQCQVQTGDDPWG